MATITNRQSITTTADQEDIFILSEAGTRFINRGNLTTTGEQASPIVVDTDDVTVRNFGILTASGENTPVILAGERDDAISGARIYNHGVIEGTSLAILIHSAGGEDSSLFQNFGHVRTSGERSQALLVFDDNGTIINRGTVSSEGILPKAIMLVGTGNHTANYGTIIAAGDGAEAVSLRGEDQTLINRGTIEARGFGGSGVLIRPDEFEGVDTATLTNFGRISGDESVSGSNGNETVINRGSLIGQVNLGGGDDTYVAGRGGTLDSILLLGTGDDLVILERRAGLLTIEDFTAGVGTDDVIDLRALRIVSFEELMSHAQDNSGSVSIDLSGGTQLVLHHITLESLAADDFLFAGQETADLASSMAGANHSAYDFLMV